MDASRASCGCFDAFARHLFYQQDLDQEARVTQLSIETRIQCMVALQMLDERNMQQARDEYAEATRDNDVLACKRLEEEHESYYDAWVRHQQCVVVLRAALKRLATVQSTAEQVAVLQKTNAVTSTMMSTATAEEVKAAVRQFETDGVLLEDIGELLERVSQSSAPQRSIHSLLPKDRTRARGRQPKGREVAEEAVPLIPSDAGTKTAHKKTKRTKQLAHEIPEDPDVL